LGLRKRGGAPPLESRVYNDKVF